ncbi:hypothetical protein MTBBW1_370010 [Desulfamplus magnetovallimortis]|uniref:PAS domain-containing protein n=1 Tax=Desulfamplus magnetovallimortis TaxID=1246637 RepID=A0A1W1HGM2_9BACT|nr:hypothetical protein MTBBW1_370010 [Desulfamplus magnetovallimortis]
MSKNSHTHPHHLDMSSIDFISLFDRLDDGVIITDRNGCILFYNKTQSTIDSLAPKDVLGLKVTEIYDLNDRTSMIMKCITKKASIRNRTFFYRTISGKIAHTITSVYPIFKDEEITGAVCFVKDYELLQRSTPMSASCECHTDLGNSTKFTFADLVGSSAEFQRAVKIARKAASSASPIMLYGETGTGKELFAQSIHNHSNRKEKNMWLSTVLPYLMTFLKVYYLGQPEGHSPVHWTKPDFLKWPTEEPFFWMNFSPCPYIFRQNFCG